MLSAVTVAAILVAGLSPFHSPDNQVFWLKNSDGVELGHHAILMTLDELPNRAATTDGPCAIEVWLQATRVHDEGTFLAFYTPENPRQFSLAEWGDGVILRRQAGRGNDGTATPQSFIPGVLRTQTLSFLTIVSAGDRTQAFINGMPVALSRKFSFSAKDLSGRLVLGASPTSGSDWSGRVLGFAYYRQSLTPAKVASHFDAWVKKRFDLIDSDSPAVLYRFDEHRGRTVHNQVGGAADLIIPAKLVVPEKPLLEDPWSEFRPTRGYWEDVLLNVAGFVPLGLIFCAYAVATGWRFPALSTVIAGFVISLAIELLQSFLPTRNSGVTDLVTNTLGTCMGIVVFHGARKRFRRPVSDELSEQLPLAHNLDRY